MRKCKLCGRRLDQDEGFCRCYMSDEALIPCTEELNRLKEFLADFKKPTLRYTGEDHLVAGLEAQKPEHSECACGNTRYDLSEALCWTCQEEEDYAWP